MWALVKSNKIEEIISSPKDMIIDNVRHPRALFSAWTDAERKAIGILPVTTSGTSLNSAYYIEKDEAFAIAGDKNSVVRTIGEKAADRKLNDEDAKDEDGKQLYEDDGTTKKINYGLKTVAKEKATTQANGLLKDFDWLIQRKVTSDTAIPSDVISYMAAIRTDHKAICDAIDGANTLTKFIALHNDTYKEVDGEQVVDVVARVNRWTDDKDVKQHRR
tara:strand:+ start:401 stop:1054 length:654 start_codon:yes stop_codon:yes gene_type:complete